ncbi:MAG TPA: hypothetical protein VGQ61_03645 [Candidatus Angelobacter sp.]|jgi:hypothetical protein|nr:hypothetical protein [Candidatus Angelobacter sp.]
MKKISTLVITLLLGAGLVMAQTGGDKSSLNPQPLPPGKKTTTTKTTSKTKKSHKGGKKGKKSSSSTTTPAPK